MATTRIILPHIGKSRTVGTAIQDILDYVKNPEKTDKGMHHLFEVECAGLTCVTRALSLMELGLNIHQQIYLATSNIWR